MVFALPPRLWTLRFPPSLGYEWRRGCRPVVCHGFYWWEKTHPFWTKFFQKPHFSLSLYPFIIKGKKAHDWVVDQLPDLFRTTTRVKTQQVVKIPGSVCRGHWAWRTVDTYKPVGTVPLVLDLHISHERWGSRTDPTSVVQVFQFPGQPSVYETRRSISFNF